MNNFNIFSLGNGISTGQGSINTKSDTKDDDNWKKTIYHHPDNLYRSYADYIAQRIDATIFYIGNSKMNATKISKMFENNYNLIKKSFSNDINIHLINLSHGYMEDYISVIKSATDEIRNTNIPKDINEIRKYEEFRTKLYDDTLEVHERLRVERESVTDLFEKVNKLANYNNRIVIIVPNMENLRYDSQTVNTFKHDTLTNPWVTFIDKDVKGMLELEEYQKVKDTITYDQHQKLGEFIYNRLTKDTKLLTI